MKNRTKCCKFHYTALVCVVFVVVGMFSSPVSVNAVDPIKFATLAPKGSTWMNSFEAMAKDIRANTDGDIRFRFYANGIQGDEIDVIRKMRAGLLHAGAMTATGLGEINEEVLIFQLPRMFKTYKELDYVRNYLREDLDKVFLDKGYVLLGMGDIGYYYIFSNHPIRNIADLQSTNVKMWVRTSDKIGIEFYQRAKIATVPREVTQVLPSLYSGQINALTASPYVTVALQWHDRFRFMTTLPINVGVGATLITKEKFDELTPEQQQVVRDMGEEYQNKMIIQIRQDNEKAVEALVKKAGIQQVAFEDDALEAWDAIAVDTQNALVGEIYSQEFLDKINAVLHEYREKQ